ncbi:MAG: hypothetical protein R2788_26705 [Saprospiraceae bacterium]
MVSKTLARLGCPDSVRWHSPAAHRVRYDKLGGVELFFHQGDQLPVQLLAGFDILMDCFFIQVIRYAERGLV